MDPARWQRLEHLCFAALSQPAETRGAYLDSACSGDSALRRDADELLAQLELDPGYLEAPLAVLPEPSAALLDVAPPDRIGPYRVIGRIGRGGMGDVLLALHESEDLCRRVAIKLIRRGMDTDEVLNRFRLERRILSSLHHPNIAALLDAGATDDGRPYFVMEYVEGRPLTEYCDAHQLSIDDRLTLFRTVCAAVQRAHQSLIVHRDLKPGNILVSADGVPKLLDFGIGKVLMPTETLSPIETRTRVRRMTPEYAAPEQITDASITTATDVYALGLLLHQLLTGRHPYLEGGESVAAIEQAVLTASLRRPSDMAGCVGSESVALAAARRSDPARLRRRLAGELDTIVLEALRREPERRYQSAAALAEDIRRHQGGLPIMARPDTAGYRLRKFARRHAAGLAVAASAFLGLAGTTIVSLLQSRRVAHESARVRQERDKAVEVRGFLMEMFGASGADQAVGDTVTARGLLDRQAARLAEAYSGRPELEAEMTEVLADGYDRLGLYAAAEPLARRALDLRDSLRGADHLDAASPLNLLGWILHERGRSEEAVPLLERAIAIRRAAGPDAARDLSRSLNDLGVVLNALKRYPDAQAVLSEALAVRRTQFGDGHRSVGITANNLAAAHYFQRRLDSAIVVQDLAVRALEASVGPDHQRSVVALGNLAAFRAAQGEREAAEADYRELLARQGRLQGDDHPVTARVMLALATLLTDRGMRSRQDSVLLEAETLLRRALGTLEARLGPEHPQVASTRGRLAALAADRGRLRDSLNP
ncbi:MAG: serine/threonine protein kinase [Gemmatimonadales bacterium]|nr:serine/threonine protein kinase [Gemmatimonadales bacterium]